MFSTGFSVLLLPPLERPTPDAAFLLKLFFLFIIVMLAFVSLAVVVSSDSNLAAPFVSAAAAAVATVAPCCFWNPAAAPLWLLELSVWSVWSFCWSSMFASLALWHSCVCFAFVTGLERAFLSGVLRARFKAYSQTLGGIAWTWRGTITVRSFDLWYVCWPLSLGRCLHRICPSFRWDELYTRESRAIRCTN